MPNERARAEQTTALALIETAVRKDKRRLKTLLPAHIPPERAIETVMAAARRTPELLECDPMSFVFALREAARWGLIPDGIMGQGYLIPRRNGKTGLLEANFQAGYRGLEDLARRTGVVASIISGWHCVNDPVFKIRLGLHGDIEHEPAFKNRGEIVGFYAAAWLNNGAPPVVVYMENAEVQVIRDAVPFWEKGPWRNHYAMMGRKTAVRRLIPQLPLSADMQAIIALDEQPWDRAIDVTPPTNGDEPPSSRKAKRMRALLDTKSGRESEQTDSEPHTTEEQPEPEPVETESVTGTIRLPDNLGLNGVETDTPSGPVIGFRLDLTDGVDAEEWMQVILSGEVLDRFKADDDIDHMIVDGAGVTVVGQRVIVSRTGPDGAALPPVIRLLATEDIQWQASL